MKPPNDPELNREYNLRQQPEGALKTLNGSFIQRSKFGVGKFINGKLYFHKNYVADILFDETLDRYERYKDKVPFDFNCIRYYEGISEIAFIECPDFDMEREPRLGMICKLDNKGRMRCRGPLPHIYHHKWTFVKSDYNGFNTAESWEWSRKWLNILTEAAIGNSLGSWQSQRARFGLE